MQNLINKLEESEDRYRQLVELSPNAILVHNGEVVLFANQAAAVLLGAVDPDEIIGMSAWAIVHSEFKSLIEQQRKQVLIHHLKATSGEIKFIRLDGVSVDVEVVAGPILYNGQKAAQLVVHDISGRRQAQEALRESEERFRLTMDVVSDGAWDWNIKTGDVFYSRRWIRSLGYKEQEVAPHISFWESIVHPEDISKTKEALDAHFSGQTEYYQCENRLRLRSGEYRWNFDQGKVVAWDANGQPVRMVGADTDVSERKRIEFMMQGRNLVLEKLATGTSLEDVLTALSISAQQILPGILFVVSLFDEDTGRLWVSAAPSIPDFYRKAIDGLQIGPKAGSCGTAVFTKKRIIVEDVTTHPYWAPYRELVQQAGFRSCCSDPIFSSSKEVLGACTTYCKSSWSPRPYQLESMTATAHLAGIAIERKKGEEKLKEYQAQLIHSERLSAIGLLGSGVAHELNSPLAGLLSLLHFYVERKKENQQNDQPLNAMLEATEHMAKIVKDLHYFSKPNHEGAEIDLVDVIESTLSFSSNQLIDRKIKIRKDFRDDDLRLEGNKSQLQQVFLNLLINARDAMPDGGDLTIVAYRHKDLSTICLEVIDTGSGIKPEYLSNLFVPFFTTKKKDQGTGLGLSISREIIKKHQGDILVKSQLGQGTTFTVILPIRERRAND